MISRGHYDGQTEELPRSAVEASLGCANPVALADLRSGETVLDLGSGGGIDVILSARRVGPEGRVYGLDMTDEMLDLARRNVAEAGVDNVELLRGILEQVPLPDESVDVVLSNCVINLSPDKPRALAEAFRVLRSGGRFAVADVVATRPMPEAVRRQVGLWSACVAGVLTVDDYRAALTGAGFEDVDLEIVATYDPGEFGTAGAEEIEDLVIEQGSPLHRLEHKLHPLVAFMIIPVFAFANAGVSVDLSTLGAALASSMTIGIRGGLFVGKQIGIVVAAWVAAREVIRRPVIHGGDHVVFNFAAVIIAHLVPDVRRRVDAFTGILLDGLLLVTDQDGFIRRPAQP